MADSGIDFHRRSLIQSAEAQECIDEEEWYSSFILRRYIWAVDFRQRLRSQEACQATRIVVVSKCDIFASGNLSQVKLHDASGGNKVRYTFGIEECGCISAVHFHWLASTCNCHNLHEKD